MRKNLKLFFFFLMLTAFSVPLSAQSIKGVVTDKASGETLIGANVIIKGTTQGTITNLDGTFLLDVPSGRNIILISFVGYLEVEKEVMVSPDDVSDMGDITLEADAIALDEMMVVASYAKDRRTPVAFSTIKPEMILEKLGTQEYPEILKSTPSVYATKGGGGYGDGRINLRGFDSNNIGVLINGVPVNDMENGKVYWSNWAGLSDVTRTMQVQRGLGASKLAISSVGGTINILTKSTDMKKGGSVYYGMGNNNYQKKSFTLSTGLLDNGWAVTVSGAQTSGDGYVQATEFNGYSYFFNISKRLSDMQTLSLTAFGSSQWHNQRSFQSIENYRKSDAGRLTNVNYGYRNGKSTNGAYGFNVYNKPQTSLNHFWNINSKTTLSTSVYASFGRGGGRRISGSNKYNLRFGYPSGDPTEGVTHLTNEGLLDYSAAIDENIAATNGSTSVLTMSRNSHNWYGILSSFNTQIGEVGITAGIDGRYYKGFHYYQIDDLLGGDYFLDPYAYRNPNRDGTERLGVGDIFKKNYVGELIWSGGFLQGEYVLNDFSAFLSTSVSNTMNRRTDFITYTPEEGQQTDWVNFLAYSVKGGANYNINAQHNVFLNGGYFIKAPFFNNVFLNGANEINKGAAPEKVLSTELGYGFKHPIFKADLTLYRTKWMDKSFAGRSQDLTFNMRNIDALHQGVELEVKINPVKALDIKLMTSVGDWKWVSNGVAEYLDESGNVVGENKIVYSEGIHVGDAAQTTAAAGIDYEVLKGLKIGFDYNYYSNLYAQFQITDYNSESSIGKDAWKMPVYQLVDFSARYKFRIGKFNTTVYGKVNNILDTEYFSDAKDGAAHDAISAGVYYGFGRTVSLGLRLKF